jgi:hypothetical protein
LQGWTELQNFTKRLQVLEDRKPVTKTPDHWRERLAKYLRWFEDGEEWVGPQTDEKWPILSSTSDTSMI